MTADTDIKNLKRLEEDKDQKVGNTKLNIQPNNTRSKSNNRAGKTKTKEKDEAMDTTNKPKARISIIAGA